jgi:3-oxoacyl-[acyl-carrier protein] reductase
MSGLLLSLEGKVALVTGGSRGIGAATVRMFRQAGAKVVFSYTQARGVAGALAAELGGDTVCRALQQELRTPEDGRALVAAAVACFGRIDCLIVNHGVWPSHDQPIDTMTDAQWRSTLAINLDSAFGLVRAVVAQMLAQAFEPTHRGETAMGGTPNFSGAVRGHIVLIASTAAQRGEAFHADYAASKGAMVSLTKSLSSELAGRGIYVNCVAPGWVATEMSAAALSDPETSNRATAPIPLGRVGHVDEIAGPVVFLCTPLAGFISGEILNVNGGAVLVG